MHRDELFSLLGIAPQPVAPFCITHVTEDSRRVTLGSLYVAVPGSRYDGYDFVADAVNRGAAAVLGCRPALTSVAGIPHVYYAEPRRAAALVAQALAGFPTTALTVCGITGTNGKTTSSRLAAAVLETAGYTTATFGTLGHFIGARKMAEQFTTPFGEDLATLFLQAKEQGVTHIVMEVSSHALAQDRVAGVHFRVGAFTNLTRDHLDFHGTMEAYRDAKRRLFEMLEAGSWAILNADDPTTVYFCEATRASVLTYGTTGEVRAESIRLEKTGAAFVLVTPNGRCDVRINLPGLHNVYNALCAAGIATALEVPVDVVAQGLEKVTCVPGRLEPVEAGQPFTVLVDYAHTDDGLRNVLQAVRTLRPHRVITVFGCGGDRDKTKRPKMAEAVAEGSDFAVLTSDNPRTEDPYAILQDAEAGFLQAQWQRDKNYAVIPDRRRAIEYALNYAQPGDVVLIAGKGHETYQIIGREYFPFDDREVAGEILTQRYKHGMDV